MAEQKDPAETVDPVVDRADPRETGVTDSTTGPEASSSDDAGSTDAGSTDDGSTDAPAPDAGKATSPDAEQAASPDIQAETPAPVRARATVPTAGALPGDLPVPASATATTYRATGSASPAAVPLPGQRDGSSTPAARASATVPGSSRVAAGAMGTPDSRASTPAVYRSGPVNTEPPEPAQPPE
ncbi:hypothetical protein FHG89_09850, partial [Micromonospora orduensis]